MNAAPVKCRDFDLYLPIIFPVSIYKTLCLDSSKNGTETKSDHSEA